MPTTSFFKGPFLIMIAASLWAVDALLRGVLIKSMPTASIVFYEHLIGFVLLLPLFIRCISKFKALTVRDWLGLIGMTVVSSALGTLLFTEALSRSFALYDFATPILLLKLQPVFVIGLAVLFLKERLTFRFISFVLVAFVGSYLVSFGAHLVPLALTNQVMVYLLSLGAAFSWGAGTILSKTALKKLTFSEATVIRYALAVPVTFIFMLSLHQVRGITELELGQVLRLVAIAFTTGAAAIFIYYKGLQRTEAKVSTIAELMYPVIGILIAITALNPYGAPQNLLPANILGIILLLGSILIISIDHVKEHQGA